LSFKKRINTQLTEIRFRISRIGIGSFRLSSFGIFNTMKFVYLFVVIVFSAGIVNAILEGSSGGNYLIIPGASIQTMFESFANSFIIIIGVLGFYLLNLGSTQSIKRSGTVPNSLIASGLMLVVVSMILFLYILGLKGY